MKTLFIVLLHVIIVQCSLYNTYCDNNQGTIQANQSFTLNEYFPCTPQDFNISEVTNDFFTINITYCNSTDCNSTYYNKTFYYTTDLYFANSTYNITYEILISGPSTFTYVHALAKFWVIIIIVVSCIVSIIVLFFLLFLLILFIICLSACIMAFKSVFIDKSVTS